MIAAQTGGTVTETKPWYIAQVPQGSSSDGQELKFRACYLTKILQYGTGMQAASESERYMSFFSGIKELLPGPRVFNNRELHVILHRHYKIAALTGRN